MDCEEERFVLSDDLYSAVCELSQNGQTRRLKELLKKELGGHNIGPETFSAEPTSLNVVRRLSPLSYACRSGRNDTVKFFLKSYPRAVVLNPGAAEFHRDPLQHKQARHDAPLYWACLNGHLTIAKLLMDFGAPVNLPNCTNSTPLHCAASNGHLHVMELLVSRGGSVNTPNLFGSSPLIAAAKGGHIKAVEYLLDRKANPNQKTIDGYTVLHVAAEQGRNRVVKLLLDQGFKIIFDETYQPGRGCIPCPVFLAASNGYADVVETLLSRTKCPPAIESDAMMLLGVGLQKADSRRRPALLDCDRILECWIKGVQLRRTYNLKPNFVTSPFFSYVSEVNTELEVIATRRSYQPEAIGGFYHQPLMCLLILERCLGAGSHIITDTLLGQDNRFSIVTTHKLSGLSERCMSQALHNAAQVWQKEIDNCVYQDPTVVQTILENYVTKLVDGRLTLLGRNVVYECINLALKVLDILQVLRSKHKCEADSLQSVLSGVLYLLASWLCSDFKQKVKSKADVCIDTYRETTGCEELGRKLVENHLHSLQGTTLLHMALNDSRLVKAYKTVLWWESLEIGSETARSIDQGLLLRGLLRWGADAAIDVFDWNGQRPLHLAVKLTKGESLRLKQSVISPLVESGAHLDYVNRDGMMPLDMLSVSEALETQDLLSPSGPVQLTCLACRKITSERLPYEEMDIPLSVKKLIRYHDRTKCLY